MQGLWYYNQPNSNGLGFLYGKPTAPVQFQVEP